MIIVVHQASMLEHVDKILVLRDGKVDAFGPKNDVIAALSSSKKTSRVDPPRVSGNGSGSE